MLPYLTKKSLRDVLQIYSNTSIIKKKKSQNPFNFEHVFFE